MKFIYRLLFAGLVMGILDFFWLAFIAREFYAGEIGELLLDQPNFIAAGLFYLIFLFGVSVFVVGPGLEKNSLKSTFLLGALFGLVTYATYDLTNLATIDGFTVKVVMIDLIWGIFISCSTSALTYLFSKKYKLE